MYRSFCLAGVLALSVGCDSTPLVLEGEDAQGERPAEIGLMDASDIDYSQVCSGDRLSSYGAEQVIRFTERTDDETIYSTYDRIDIIAGLFEECGDPWGMFPTTYRRITARGLDAVANDEFIDPDWARRIIVDFAGRYMDNLALAMSGKQPSWAWKHYYYLADRDDVSRTRAVVVGMVAHLTLDLPHSLVAIDSNEDHEEDFFTFGEMMIEVSDLLIDDLYFYYGAESGDLLNGFFFGDWIDGAFGEETTITLSYQTIRTKSWNNMWLLGHWSSSWIADSEIYMAFWTIDGVLATLDATGVI